MYFLNFDDWSMDSLNAYAIIVTLLALVGLLIFIFRELGSSSEKPIPKKKKGDYGFAQSEGETFEMEVVQIRQLSDTVKNFRLRPPEGKYAHYFPGQFLTFHVGENQEVARCYSLSSSPSRPGMYEVSVKKLEGGRGSTWMHDKVKVGETLKVTNPSGRFFLKQEAASSTFVAGGIGITPMLSMLKYCVDRGDPRPLYFFYAARSVEDLVFLNELEDLASLAPNVTFVPVLSRAGDGWQGATGRLSEELMLKTGINFKETELYTCGPAPMMDLAKEISTKNGMPKEKFHNEVFASPSSQKMEKRKCQIHLSQSEKTLDYDDNIPLLDFLEQNDVPISFSCRAGVCGTCEVTLEKGDVNSLPSDFLSEEDLAAGRRLSCISYPKENISLEL